MGATIRASVQMEGMGLHTGEPCCIRLHPHSPGIWFQKGQVRLPARWDYVCDTTRCTTLGDQDVKIMTVEHLMAALWSQGITGCIVEVVRGQEIPALDGSALPFVQELREVGLESVPGWLQGPLAPVLVQEGERLLGVAPGEPLAFGYLQLPEPLGVQAGYFALDAFEEQIAPARTFGFLHEVETLRARGLAQGGSLENALVLDETGYYNPPRFHDEPLRHKILDALGDLYLCGEHLSGFHLIAIKSGHRLGVQLAQQVAHEMVKNREYRECRECRQSGKIKT